MDTVDWTALSLMVTIFVTVVLGAFGYLSRQLSRVEGRLDAKIDGLEGRLTARIDRLEERYVRHLELHAGH